MKPTRTFAAIIALLYALLPYTLHGGVVPTPGSESVPKLFGQASLVFKGEIMAVSPAGEREPGWDGRGVRMRFFKAAARVDRAYKGQAPVGIVTIFFGRPEERTCSVSPCESLSVGEYNLFFVTGAPGHYHLLDMFFGKFAVSRLNAAEPRKGLDGLESDLIAGLYDREQPRLLRNIELLGAMERLRSSKPLHDLLPAADLKTQAAVYVALLRLHDYSELGPSGALFGTLASSPDPEIQMLQFRMSTYVMGITDPETIPTLIGLAHSQSDPLREGAIHALREMAAPVAVPTFIAALHDPMPLIRFDAMFALATIESRPDLMPPFDGFEHAESPYIRAWEAWWEQTGRAKYGQRVH